MPSTWFDCTSVPPSCRNWRTCATCIPSSIYQICHPLFSSSELAADGVTKLQVPPRLDVRISTFRKGIEALMIRKDQKAAVLRDVCDDLMTLVGYRKLVTQCGGLPLDRLLFNLADALATCCALDWGEVAKRMPDRAPIREACLRRARGEPLCPELVAMGWSEPV